jgi:hypothetical protein
MDSGLPYQPKVKAKVLQTGYNGSEHFIGDKQMPDVGL